MPLLATVVCTLVSLRGPVDLSTTSAAVAVGAIVRRIVVTGTLQPMAAVDVGTQVSGTIDEVDADYNAIVHAGQILLQLDAASAHAALDQARASLAQARADVANFNATADAASADLTRAESLAAESLIPESDLDAARTAVAQADADVSSARARVQEAAAEVKRAVLSVQQTVIRSPVDGVVMSRNVDAGDTVAAVQSAPVLFQIATDFLRMQVVADVDESDVADIRVGALVRFQVEAYPQQAFQGQVAEIRLDAIRDQPATDSSTPGTAPQTAMSPAVVSYPVVITVANPDEKLRPGMTAP
jgi:HlyD family secretion protein